MAKQAYRIPADLDTGPLDMEISLKTESGFGPRPIPIKLVLIALVSILGCYYVLSITFVQYASILLKIIFCVLWALLTFLLLKPDDTDRLKFKLVPALFQYLPKSARKVMTRSNNKAAPFYSILGVDDIDEHTGVVRHTDGTCSLWFSVAGSASILLFEEDKNAIIDRADSFYQKQGTDYELLILTRKSSQKVYNQVVACQDRLDNLSVQDDDLDGLLNEQFHVLKDVVGKLSKSVHQYLIIKAENEEVLWHARNILQSEVENSSLFIKQCSAMYRQEIIELLRVIYRGEV